MLDQQLNALQKVLAPYPGAYDLAAVGLLLVVAWLANWVTKRILLRVLQKVLDRAPWARQDGDGKPLRMSVIRRLANVVPALVIQLGLAWVPDLPAKLVAVVQAGCQVFIVLTVALAISHALNLANEIYERRPDARNRPIKGFLQVIKIIIFVLAGLSMVATLSGVSFGHIVTGLGAIMAVLILVFQDTLLSLVASVQISTDGRVRIGDWIEMPSQNADGTVTDIALHTVTVQNWDMTITTIPTKKLISESFKNWRGMYASGGRRIKRSILLDQHSVRFLSDEEIAHLRQFTTLADYLDGKDKEIAAWNSDMAKRGIKPASELRPTNLGAFRAYVERYLRLDPHIRQDMLLMVRQLQPDANGLPLEIWCFADQTGIVGYEQIQADVIDHLLALLPSFDLHVFQVSSDAMLMRDAEARQPPRNRILAAIAG
nr:mechanosensitive ion channel domain-containing protein [Stenotrophomonas sp. MMGLT7]